MEFLQTCATRRELPKDPVVKPGIGQLQDLEVA
jgi:hypothetical protein